MNDSILVKLRGDREYITFRTVAHGDGGRRSTFYASRNELLRLERESEVILRDCSYFAVLRHDFKSSEVTVSLYWLSEHSDQVMIGRKQQFRLPYIRLRDFLEGCTEKNVMKEERMLSLPEKRGPKIVFEDTGNLRKAVSDKRIRRKLAKFLRSAFGWSGATEIRLYDDFVPYSFYFRELRGDAVGINGGVIYHDCGDPRKAYYSIHT